LIGGEERTEIPPAPTAALDPPAAPPEPVLADAVADEGLAAPEPVVALVPSSSSSSGVTSEHANAAGNAPIAATATSQRGRSPIERW
jgi:hypothetical protein